MAVDWTGNKRSTFATLGASNHVEHNRANHDYYATDPSCALDLINILGDSLYNIWEPACGEGHLAKVFDQYGLLRFASDLVYRGYGRGDIDFLNTVDETFDGWIVTNPPYKYAMEFCLKALSKTPNVAMFLKTQFLEGQNRYKHLFSVNPPNKVYIYVKRQRCGLNGNFKGSSAVSYAWFVWGAEFANRKPEIEWVV